MPKTRSRCTEREGNRMLKPQCRRCKIEIPAGRLSACRGYCKSCHALYCATCECMLTADRKLLGAPEKYFCEACWTARRFELRVVAAEVESCLEGLIGEIKEWKQRGWSSTRIAESLDRANLHSEGTCGMSVTARQVDVLWGWVSVAGSRPPWVTALEGV